MNTAVKHYATQHEKNFSLRNEGAWINISMRNNTEQYIKYWYLLVHLWTKNNI